MLKFLEFFYPKKKAVAEVEGKDFISYNGKKYNLNISSEYLLYLDDVKTDQHLKNAREEIDQRLAMSSPSKIVGAKACKIEPIEIERVNKFEDNLTQCINELQQDKDRELFEKTQCCKRPADTRKMGESGIPYDEPCKPRTDITSILTKDW